MLSRGPSDAEALDPIILPQLCRSLPFSLFPRSHSLAATSHLLYPAFPPSRQSLLGFRAELENLRGRLTSVAGKLSSRCAWMAWSRGGVRHQSSHQTPSPFLDRLQVCSA